MTEDNQPLHKATAESTDRAQSSSNPPSPSTKPPPEEASHMNHPNSTTTTSFIAHSASSSTLAPMISVTVAPFTGGPFAVSVSRKDSIDELKKVVAKRLKVLKDRICLLYRERQLSEGTLEDNFVVDGSRITLLPRAETGLLAQKPEQSVMQALESLSESQVVDFLSGKAPLNLTMRLGDHMMLIQLQLSTVNSSGSKRARTSMTPTTATSSPLSSSLSAESSPTSSSGSSSTLSSASTSPSMTTSKTSSTFSSTYKPKLDTRALAEASKNLTQTLKQLSSEVLTSKSTEESADRQRKRARPSGGAIIESMHHHGKGVYSGTFSGTLNPALQDKNGQPKRDITTIIHILNDLLCAQYKNYNYSHRSSSKMTVSGTSSGEACSATFPGNTFSSQGKIFPDESTCPNQHHDELLMTKGKIEQLRKIMEERKAKRRARREARAAPYSTSWSVKSEPSSESNDSSGPGEQDNPVESAEMEEGTNSSSNTSSGSESGRDSASSDTLFSTEPEPVTA